MIPEWIPMLIILLFGLNNPNDLRKQPTKKDFKKSFNYWVQRNFPVIAFITVMICLVIFVLVCFTIVGASVESGNYYNHFHEVI